MSFTISKLEKTGPSVKITTCSISRVKALKLPVLNVNTRSIKAIDVVLLVSIILNELDLV